MKTEVSWTEVLSLLSPAGQEQLVDFVREAKEVRGRNWLPEIEREFPLFSWIVDLVCSRTPEEAFTELQNQYPGLPLQIVRPQLQTLHARLKSEIERKR